MTMNLIDNIHIDWKQIFHAMKKYAKPCLRQLALTGDSNER